MLMFQDNFDVMSKLMVENPYIIGAVVIGQTQNEICASLDREGFTAYVREETFKGSILTASQMCPEGGNVLLSPACASFDMFKDFEQRGEVFKEIVNALE